MQLLLHIICNHEVFTIKSRYILIIDSELKQFLMIMDIPLNKTKDVCDS